MNIIELLYRDGANYKWDFCIRISDEKLQALRENKKLTLVEGVEITYDNDLGITQKEFHEKRGYAYDDEIDHNILEVQSVSLDLGQETCSFEIL